VAVIGFYNKYQTSQTEKERLAYEHRTYRWVMGALGCSDLADHYKQSSYDEKYYQEFLEDENVPVRLRYLKEYMEKNHPDIGYCQNHLEITMDRLREEPIEVGEELHLIAGELEKKNIYISDVITMITMEMMDNDEYTELPGFPTDEQNTYRWVMEVLGRSDLAGQYKKSLYDEKYYQEFLEDENVPVRLRYLKEYMVKNHPDIGYCQKHLEITMDRLREEPIEVGEELRLIEKELKKKNSYLSDVIDLIDQEMIANEEYVGLPE